MISYGVLLLNLKYYRPVIALRNMVIMIVLLLANPCFGSTAESFQNWINRIESNNVKASVGLWDISSGKCIDSHNSSLPLIPASTTKVISTYAILKTLKPNFQLSTEVWGDLRGSTIYGDLVIKGFGDPFFTSERIWLLVNKLKSIGILTITGNIYLDQSAFDQQKYGNGWHNTSSDTTPPILPLSVNFNREQGKITNNPENLALRVIMQIIDENGISIQCKSVTDSNMKKLITFPSLPLRDLVVSINKVSNNFMIEMLVKYFGDGTWPTGIRRIQDFYAGLLNLGPDQISITDGSGLSKDNRISARTLAIILRAIWHDFEVGPEIISSFKTSITKYQRDKFYDLRCKTGHLKDVVSICGYLQTKDGGLKIFAIILNGPCSDNDILDLVNMWARQY